MDNYKRQFIDRASLEATRANHVFPTMAACEAALESSFGTSKLAIEDFNLFGMKQHYHPIYGTHILPTREWVGISKDTKDGKQDGWVTINASWVKYPSYTECFIDRMNTLRRLSSSYPHYKAALEATDPIVYVKEVSATWSTDPKRAEKVISIYKDYLKM